MFTQNVVTQLRGRLAGLLAFGVLLMLGQSAYAAGTAANTLVTNNVTVVRHFGLTTKSAWRWP